MDMTLRDLQGGRVPGALVLREEYQADLVQLLSENSAYCGMGYIMTKPTTSFASYGFTVVATGCISYYSHIHEWGHNMGADHNKNDAGSPGWTYAYGQQYCTTGGYRTVMSYSCSTGSYSRVPYFSNPDISYNGLPTGITGMTQNAQVLQQTVYYVANFRQSATTGSPTPAPVSPAPVTPTGKPTSQPTPSPTRVPTNKPTRSPTAKPTTTPTGSPTAAVTAPPTAAPTAAAASPPTAGPTAAVTAAPVSGSATGGQLQYLGCYTDAPDRALTGGSATFRGTLTPQVCADYCMAKGYGYIALQYSYECFCGPDTSYSRYGASTGCSMSCDGDSKTKCGGSWANSVYQISGADPAPSTAASSRYMGCYKDADAPRALTGTLTNNWSSNSKEVCRAQCTGYKYYGMEYGFSCYCGNTYDSNGPADNCNMACTGDSTQMCGGSWAISVYAV